MNTRISTSEAGGCTVCGLSKKTNDPNLADFPVAEIQLGVANVRLCYGCLLEARDEIKGAILKLAGR